MAPICSFDLLRPQDFLLLICAAGALLGIYGPDFVAGAISLQILAGDLAIT
jgi:hypothetical protein